MVWQPESSNQRCGIWYCRNVPPASKDIAMMNLECYQHCMPEMGTEGEGTCNFSKRFKMQTFFQVQTQIDIHVFAHKNAKSSE